MCFYKLVLSIFFANQRFCSLEKSNVTQHGVFMSLGIFQGKLELKTV